MLDQQAVAGIIEHMNEDHADAVLLYVKAFGGHRDALSARLATFDAHGMGIDFVDADGTEDACRIDFEQPLAHAGEARSVLVEMVNQARQQIAE